MSFISNIFNFFADLFYSCEKRFFEIFSDMELHYGCPNSKRIEKLNLKRQNYN
jgi:hypothetical protein